jgi:hypothetical protein
LYQWDGVDASEGVLSVSGMVSIALNVARQADEQGSDPDNAVYLGFLCAQDYGVGAQYIFRVCSARHQYVVRKIVDKYRYDS